MTLRTGVLNGNNNNDDFQFQAGISALLSQGVVAGFLVSAGSISAGYALISVTRGVNTFLVPVHSDTAITVDTTGTKKVWLQIDSAKVTDNTAGLENGSDICSVQTGASYPVSGYWIPLASITSGTIADARVLIRPVIGKQADTAGASTIELGLWTARYGKITGSGASISSLGTMAPAGEPFVLHFGGANTLVHSSNLVLPTGANLSTATNDMGIFVTDGAGVWRCLLYSPASGIPLVTSIDIEGKAEDTDPDGDEYLLQSKSSTQKKVLGTTARYMPKPPASYAIGVGAPVMAIEGYIIASNKSAEQTNTAGGTDFIGYSTTKRKESQLVTMPTGYGKQLSKFTAKLRTVGSPTGSLTCKVYSDQGITLVATSSSVLVSTLSGSFSDVEFLFPNKELLAEGSQYYFTIETTQADSTSNYVEWGVSSTNLYSGGNAYNVNSSGAYALYGSNLDFAFSLWTESAPGYIVKATKSTGFIGVLKKAVSAFGDLCNIQTYGNVKGLDFGTETETVSATVDLNQTSGTDIELQVYSGQGDQMFAFLTGEVTGNLTSFDVNIAQNGTGGGILTANVHECTGYGANMAVSGASLGSAVINSPTSGVNTFTPGSAITLRPNTWYIIKFTSASGNSTNRWDIRGNNSSAGAGSNGTGDGTRVFAYFSSAWQYNAAPYLVTRYTSKLNYCKCDFAYLGDTAGVFDSCRKANNPIPVGRIIDQNNLVLEKYDGGRLLGSGSYAIANTSYYRGSVPIPKNCSRVRAEISNGSNSFGYFDFKISEMGTDRTINFFGGGSMATATLNLHRNYIRAIGPTATLNLYFYQ